ncbi:MAG TPA: sulfatase-like hydrolase/transferase [Terriglobales bacterium]|nr:sulfatase-like hydrolase/transferase [Terriglobales bacterium]
MRLARLAFFLGRLTYATVLLITSVYCLLAFIPFTYQQVHVGRLLPWLTTVVHIHPYLYVAALVLLAPTLLADLRTGRSRTVTGLFLVSAAGAGIALCLHPLLAELGNDRVSLLWSLAALVPLVWVAACDWLAKGGALEGGAQDSADEGRVFRAAWQSALFLALLYAAVQWTRSALLHNVRFPARQWAWGLTWSVLSHLLFFMGVFVVLSLTIAVAALFPQKRKAEFAGATLIAVALVWVVFRSVVFPPLSFRGWMADGMALALAVALVAFSTGMSVSLYREEEGPAESGLALLLWPMSFLRRWRPWMRVGFFAGLAVLTYWLATASAMLDWEYLVQKLVVVFVWTVSFAAFYAIAPAGREKGSATMHYVAAGLVLVTYVILLKAEPRQPEPAGEPAGEVAGLLDEYANYDVSFRLTEELISGPTRGTAAGGDASSSFYAFLAENTHISRSRRVAPVDINLVDRFPPANGPRPNIFLFVIDSLRSDYLGAYNPAVTFTPALDRFARDAVVMENAFTRYGGTGLSEPSIWVGGLMLHKQYITPFPPMNTLKKLVDAAGYDAYVSKDTILQTVLGPSPEIHELDATVGTMYYDFCRTLDEVTRTLPSRAAGRPMFVYTQPQNIHVSVIDREGRSVPPGATFPPGFNPPYAARVARMDRCFGQFIGALKKAGMYDDSVIIVTADHGDSLGERGRWGHAYAIFPEILRVPLIFHLPPALKAKLAYDTKKPAFLTDITPTLYYLLAAKPRNDPLFGRPLFTETIAEQTPYLRDSYLVASSYAPVYGLLSRDGSNLYIADGVNYREYFYDLAQDPRGVTRPVTDALRTREQGLIRQHLKEIAQFYHLD